LKFNFSILLKFFSSSILQSFNSNCAKVSKNNLFVGKKMVSFVKREGWSISFGRKRKKQVLISLPCRQIVVTSPREKAKQRVFTT